MVNKVNHEVDDYISVLSDQNSDCKSEKYASDEFYKAQFDAVKKIGFLKLNIIPVICIKIK